ncbi:hypothetical protein AMC90_PD00945 (plasmid) [Rhizobium phaseoli]|uniref:dihydrofolate reductase family protein n=1 Tax=Rhizobium phaseoli TaxID=396 RepID=UPI0007F13C81|nr:dihydrofolate reductase family protein [Rhizobium phaseoli]ANL31970.1 hypothetical protein AMC90_PD00945 [Rhizobium phaseoli]
MHQRSSGLQEVEPTSFAAGGLVDEIELRIVPVLFGAGTRMLDTLPNQIKLEPTSMLGTPRNTSMTATSISTPHSIALYPRQKRQTLC